MRFVHKSITRPGRTKDRAGGVRVLDHFACAPLRPDAQCLSINGACPTVLFEYGNACTCALTLRKVAGNIEASTKKRKSTAKKDPQKAEVKVRTSEKRTGDGIRCFVHVGDVSAYIQSAQIRQARAAVDSVAAWLRESPEPGKVDAAQLRELLNARKHACGIKETRGASS